MDEIAKRSGYSKSTIYVYFKSKDEIYNYIIYGSMYCFKETMAKSISGAKDFKNRFFSVCSSIAKFQEDYPRYFEDIIGQIEVVEMNR